MSPIAGNLGADPEGFPRVSGDEPEESKTGGWTKRFSPRERG